MKSLEAVLSDHGVSDEDLRKAAAYRSKVGGSLERILLNMGSFSEDLLPEIYARFLQCPILSADQRDSWQPHDAQLPIAEDFLLSNGWMPFGASGSKTIVFVTKDPLNWNAIQYLNNENIDFKRIISSKSDFDMMAVRSLDPALLPSDSSGLLSDVEEDRLKELASEAPTVNLLNSLIDRALRMRASDMHIEPVENRYRVRFRIDGVLHNMDALPELLQLAVVSRIKILSGMDIAEKRRPQDGRIEMRVANTSLDLRVSSLPVNKGESVVMRFLVKDALNYDIDSLGLAADTQAFVREDLQKTAGVILMTGPTGSGKTTSLYTFLHQLNEDGVKIVTLEDPVEYQLKGLNQVQVKPDIGFDFRAGLRSVVRQDPDVIMVGEIRDKETCQIAMQAALTGHLVFSTVHTNDAPSAFTRLLDLGVEEFLMNAALISIMAQRLVRKLCTHCALPSPKSHRIIEQNSLKELATRFGWNSMKIMEAKGCEHCSETGFNGRIAIIEYLRCDEGLRAIQKDDQFLPRAREHNRKSGQRNLLEDGLLKVLEGKTTVEEVLRVCG